MLFRSSTCRLLVLFLLVLMPLLAAPSQAAEPGAELVNASGVLNTTVPSRTLPLYSTGPANFRLSVSGGAASDTITLTLRDNAANPLKSWVVRSGETAWGYADIPAGSSLLLQNNSSAALNYALSAYSRGNVANIAEGETTWSGAALGDGGSSTNSAIQLIVPTAGLYTFTLNAAQGSYQLDVDSNYIRKNVVSGSSPDPADSTYYLGVGIHTFTIIQDPTAAALTNWSVKLDFVGGSDTLPNVENSAQLGGGLGSGTFNAEATPIYLAAAQPVNMQIAVTGSSADSLSLELSHGTTPVFTSSPVSGGEVVWVTTELAAGVNRLRVTADGGNSAPLAYAITTSPIGQPGFSWSGVSYGPNPGNSTIRLTFPADGLYRFTMAASSGRYQFLLADSYLKKVITASGADFTAFIPAGTHQLVIDQDSTTNTAWSVDIASTETPSDSLPYPQAGTTLGGGGNDFGEEWLPIHLTADTPVNIKVIAQGSNAGDSLSVELYNSPGGLPVFTAGNVYKDEIYWATSQLVSGTNLLRIGANAGNTAAMSYQIEVMGVAAIPTTWSGVSLGNGLNSTVQLIAPEDGVYNVTMTVSVGAGQVQINNATLAQQEAGLASSSTTLRVPLSAGPHTFVFQQDPGQPTTEWQIATSLRRGNTPLSIASVTPSFIPAATDAIITVTGQGFESDTVVEVVASDGSVVSFSSVIVSSSEIRITVPASATSGVYTFRLTNSDGSILNHSGALSIGETRIYLAIVSR